MEYKRNATVDRIPQDLLPYVHAGMRTLKHDTYIAWYGANYDGIHDINHPLLACHLRVWNLATTIDRRLHNAYEYRD